MTRNEWIAETARMYRVHGRWGAPSVNCLETFQSMADAIEAAAVDAVAVDASGYVRWQPPAPALTDTAAKVVEAAEGWLGWCGEYVVSKHPRALADAVRAHLAAKQGGAK